MDIARPDEATFWAATGERCPACDDEIVLAGPAADEVVLGCGCAPVRVLS